MAVIEGVGGGRMGWEYEAVDDMLSMKTSMKTTQVGAQSGAYSSLKVSKANTVATASKVGVLNVPYDPELWAILALGGV